MQDGKTALVLGGGGSRGAYEIGVWQALNELGIEINIVTGTSIGAINGAMVAQGDFEKALSIWHAIAESTITELNEQGTLKNILENHLNEQIIRDSKIAYGVVTVEFPNFNPHHVFIEDIPVGKLRDYILASSAFFPVITPHEIDNKKFIDGGYLDNLPVNMVLEKGAVNVIAVDLEALGIVNKSALKIVPALKMISSSWDLGDFMSFNPTNIRRIMRLGYLDAMKSFDVFVGKKYTFIKGEFAKRGLKEADAAAEIYELDPSLIYSKEMLDKQLYKAIALHKSSSNKKNPKQKLEVLLQKKEALSPLDVTVETITDGLSALESALSPKTITLVIAQKIADGSLNNSLTGKLNLGKFLSQKSTKLLSAEILAACYISKSLKL
jgi:NTE family protein